jgi:hypothetical protein
VGTVKILHISKHEIPYLNDDEGSISHSLRTLGHKVFDVLEYQVPELIELEMTNRFDLTLFHHWYDGLDAIPKLPGIKVSWYFDYVSFKHGIDDRSSYIKAVNNSVDYVFSTDGDWAKDNGLQWLTQGADQRIANRYRAPKDIDVLFVGSAVGERKKFLKCMKLGFKQFTHANNDYRIDLGKMIARAKTVVCPDTPITPRYWSNRVYVMCGFGGFVLHPRCELVNHYKDGEEIVYYDSHDDLCDKIRYYLDHDEERDRIAHCGWKRTIKEHTYLHRCKKLMEIVT